MMRNILHLVQYEVVVAGELKGKAAAVHPPKTDSSPRSSGNSFEADNSLYLF